jgi:isoquinoline 1-oxidoreductase beta subunit
LLVGGGVGVGLVLAWYLLPGGIDSDLSPEEGAALFGNYLQIDRDGRVTVAVPQVETGQGAWTALPQILADELGAAWDKIAVEPAPLVAAYANPLAKEQGWLEPFGTLEAFRLGRNGAMRITADATSVRAFETPLRMAGATARTMLVGAAADRWNVDPDECEAREGYVYRQGQSFAFGELAEEAATRRPPSTPSPRRIDQGRLIGQPLPRLDGPAKASGAWRFASDVRLPGLLFASARIAPPGGKLEHFDRSAIAGAPGVHHVAARDGWIALAAESWWQAERALEAANPRFSAPASGDPRAQYEAVLTKDAFTELVGRGDYDSAVRGSRPLSATYYVAPSQHLALEPQSATARLESGSIELWTASQAPGTAQVRIREGSLYPMPIGEPAGRAMGGDAAPIALELARAVGRPVQVTISPSWGQVNDALSPGALMRLSALPGAGGLTGALRMDLVSADGMAASLARLAGTGPPDRLGQAAFDRIAPTYAIPNLSVRGGSLPLEYACGYMRGSPEREAVFAIESFMDELARAAGMAPLNLRMALLGSNGRLARCFQTAARRAGWDGGLPGSSMGIAGASAYGSHIALVASASITPGQRIAVDQLTCAVDCGRIVNPGLVRQQVEGALIWAIGQATTAEPEWRGARPIARPLAAIGLPTLSAVPKIDVVLVSSSETPGGVNGLGALPLAPAIANSLFAATGKRMRSLPLDPMGA